MTAVLITGAGGFLGGAVVKGLHGTGVDVHALVRDSGSSSFPKSVQTLVGDIRDPACLTKATAGCDMVIHLAGKAHALEDDRVSDEEYQSVNVEGTRQLLKASALNGVRKFIFASSVKVFGETTNGCVDENSPAAPQTPYARSKWDAEQLVASSSKAPNLATLSLRLPLVYGPAQKGNLYRMIAAIDHHRFPPLPLLRSVRSMLHVQNFVSAIRAALRSDTFPKPMYVAADAKPYSTTEIYDMLRKELGRPAPHWRVPFFVLAAGAQCGDVLQALVRKPMPLSTSVLNKLVGEAWYSPAALMRDLGYQPRLTFEMAVPELIRHYRRSVS